MFSIDQSNKIVDSLSTARFKTYQNALYGTSTIADHKAECILFYTKIQDIYSCFYTPIQFLEITLRNKIHIAKTAHYHDENWFNLLKEEKFTTYKAKDILRLATNQLRRDFKKKTRSALPEDTLCRITFGFWVELTTAPYRQSLFWQTQANNVFPNKGKNKLGSIQNDLLQINTLRNRLYHYEPLWKITHPHLAALDVLKKIESDHAKVLKVLQYCSNEQIMLLEQTNQISNFKNKCDELRNSLGHLEL